MEAYRGALFLSGCNALLPNFHVCVDFFTRGAPVSYINFQHSKVMQASPIRDIKWQSRSQALQTTAEIKQINHMDLYLIADKLHKNQSLVLRNCEGPATSFERALQFITTLLLMSVSCCAVTGTAPAAKTVALKRRARFARNPSTPHARETPTAQVSSLVNLTTSVSLLFY